MTTIKSIIIGPFARNVARVVGGVLIGKGLASPEMVGAITPDMEALIGAALIGVAEAVYVAAKKRGWTT